MVSPSETEMTVASSGTSARGIEVETGGEASDVVVVVEGVGGEDDVVVVGGFVVGDDDVVGVPVPSGVHAVATAMRRVSKTILAGGEELIMPL